MTPKEANERAAELITIGQKLLSATPSSDGDREYWITGDNAVRCRSLLTQVRNFVDITCRAGDTFHTTVKEIVSHKDFAGNSFPTHALESMQGMMDALAAELRAGRLQNIAYQVSAQSFVTFLEHAIDLAREGDHQGSGVLVSVVFEDTVRKLAEKNNLNTGDNIDSILDRLVAVNALTAVKRSRAKALAALRNKALHAKWTEYDINDVRTLFDSVRELIERLDA
jgi:hypothetical protein